MTRILFTSTPGAGHFNPLVPFIRGCADRARVAIAGAESLRAQADRLGVEFFPLPEPPADAIGAALGRAAAAGPERGDAIVVSDVFVGLDAAAQLPALLAVCAEWRPDVLVHESAEFSGPLAAAALGIPSVRGAVGLGVAEEVLLSFAHDAFAELGAGHGLDAPDLRGEPVLTLFPAGLEEPCSLPAPTRYRDPYWDAFRGRERSLVYLTFGSIAGGVPFLGGVYNAAATAADGVGDALLTVGCERDPGTVPAPPNVRVEQWVDQASVLPRARAVVCHAGGGTTLGALAAGCPIVAVPLLAGDQFINARRLEEVGAGRRVAPEEPALRAALTEVLGDPAYRRAAEALADELAAQPSAAGVLDELTAAAVA